ncbi:hypothetical protein FKM82_023243 [Ascaphus truei]
MEEIFSQFLHQQAQRDEMQAQQTEKLLQMLAPSPASVRPEIPNNPPVMLPKMKPTEDPEAFLITFERVSMAHGWIVDHWVITLAPLLIGEAQAAYQALLTDEVTDY